MGLTSPLSWISWMSARNADFEFAYGSPEVSPSNAGIKLRTSSPSGPCRRPRVTENRGEWVERWILELVKPADEGTWVYGNTRGFTVGSFNIWSGHMVGSSLGRIRGSNFSWSSHDWKGCEKLEGPRDWSHELSDRSGAIGWRAEHAENEHGSVEELAVLLGFAAKRRSLSSSSSMSPWKGNTKTFETTATQFRLRYSRTLITSSNFLDFCRDWKITVMERTIIQKCASVLCGYLQWEEEQASWMSRTAPTQ